MKRLLVGSIFAPDVRNAHWLRLQLQFLRATVGDFDHAVFLNRVEPGLFTESHVIGAVSPEEQWAGDELPKAMDTLMHYFHDAPGYDYYLMIDSDAFPARAGWLGDLVALMEPRPEYGLIERRFAAPVRCENLDSFPHGSAFFAKGDWFRDQDPDRFSWDYMPRVNFMGSPSKDITLKAMETIRNDAGEQIWLPLMRTNTVNYHPIMGAIYGHAFFHHGAGSRDPKFRAVLQGAYDNFADQAETDRRNVEMFAELIENPEAYVRGLYAPQAISRTSPIA